MDKQATYEQTLKEQIELLKSDQTPTFIFGCKASGIMCKRAAEHLHMNLLGFCDNDAGRHGTSVDGAMVYSPETVFQKYPNAQVFIGLLDNDNISSVLTQLNAIGFHKIYLKDALMYVFQIEILKRPVNSAEFAETLRKLNDKNALTFIGVGCFITERCNLRCEDCGYFIPYYKPAQDQPKESVIASLRNFCAAIDGLAQLTILGGETLLYHEQDLIEICHAAYCMPNILLVRVITNGTIVPSDTLAEGLSKNLTHANISDYESLSRNISQVEQKFKAYGMVYDIAEQSTTWYPTKCPADQHRMPEQKQELFDKCCLEKDIIHNGALYPCECSVVIAAQGKTSKDCKDFVPLLGVADEHGLREKLKGYRENKGYLEACGFCRCDFEGKAVRARQTKEQLQWK